MVFYFNIFKTPVEDKWTETLPFGAAHTYMAYIREYCPSPDVAGHLSLDLVDLSQNYQSKPDDFDN